MFSIVAQFSIVIFIDWFNSLFHCFCWWFLLLGKFSGITSQVQTQFTEQTKNFTSFHDRGLDLVSLKGCFDCDSRFLVLNGGLNGYWIAMINSWPVTLFVFLKRNVLMLGRVSFRTFQRCIHKLLSQMSFSFVCKRKKEIYVFMHQNFNDRIR